MFEKLVAIEPVHLVDEGGILSIECAIDSSKVNVVCPKCGKSTRVEYKVEENKKVRICKKCGTKIK